MRTSESAIIYPSLPARHDLGVVRIVGHGLGNCLYAYFHAVVAAKAANGRLLAPTWPSLRIGPIIRWERTLRRYGKMFRAHPDEITGLAKIAHLASGWHNRRKAEVRVGQQVAASPSGLTVVVAPEFTFVGLHQHREMIRRRLLQMLASPPAVEPRWGKAPYVAAHIRLGDFHVAQQQALKSGKVHNLRIPLAWYASVIRRLREVFPELPVYIFSDGREHELEAVLSIDGVSLMRKPDDVADLLAMAEARLLIGSNSTFVRWAAFLGDMPSIWFETEQHPEKPTGEQTPITYIGDDPTMITRDVIGVA